MLIKRGSVYMADLGEGVGSEQSFCRPVLIIQNDTGNLYSETTVVIALTSQKKKPMPTHTDVYVQGRRNTVLAEQVRTISRTRLSSYMGRLTDEEMERVERALRISQGMDTRRNTADGAYRRLRQAR